MSDLRPDVSSGFSWSEVYKWFNTEAVSARAKCASLSEYVAALDELATRAEERYVSSHAHKRNLWDSIEEITEMDTGLIQHEVNGDPVLGARARAERDQYRDGLEKLNRLITRRREHHRERYIHEVSSAAFAGSNRVPARNTDLGSWKGLETEFLQYATEHAGLQAIWAWKYTRDRHLLLGPPEGYWILNGGSPGSQHLFREIAGRAVGRLSNASAPEPWRSWLDQLRAEGYARKIPARKVSPREFRAAVQASGQPPLPPNFESEHIENVFKSSAEYCKVRSLSERQESKASDPFPSKGEPVQASEHTQPGRDHIREVMSPIYDARFTNEPVLASRIPQPDHQPAATPVGNKKSEASPNSVDSPEDNNGTVLAATATPSASSSSAIDIPIPAVPLERESEHGPDVQQTEPDQPQRALKRATEPTAEQRAIAEKLVSEQSEVSIKIAACWLPCSIQHMRRLAKNGDVIASRTKPMRIQTESLRTYKWGKTATKTTNPRPLDPSERAQ